MFKFEMLVMDSLDTVPGAASGASEETFMQDSCENHVYMIVMSYVSTTYDTVHLGTVLATYCMMITKFFCRLLGVVILGLCVC